MFNIKYVFFDLDGVLCPRTFLMFGCKYRFYNTADGLGITCLLKAGLKVGIITHSDTKECEKRYNQLKMNGGLYLNVKSKYNLIKKLNIPLKKIAYMGDDIIDIKLLRECDFSGCPCDALSVVPNIVDFQSRKNGGYGAVRDFCEEILIKKYDLDTVEKKSYGLVQEYIAFFCNLITFKRYLNQKLSKLMLKLLEKNN